MNVLDEYVVTNKRCRFYGQRVWMIKAPSEKDVGGFITSALNTIRLKMSSVAFSRPCYTEGQIVTDGLYVYSIDKIWYRRYYVCKVAKGHFAGVTVNRYPWNITSVKARIV